LEAGKIRARHQLDIACALEVVGNKLKVFNLTGHKLISGYPEGRRMWLQIKWYDQQGGLIREDGAYGALSVTLDGDPLVVDTILDLDGTNTKIYEIHPGLTQEWAAQLVSLGYPQSLVLNYDRVSGEPVYTLGDLAAEPPGTIKKTFHFVLNNAVAHDNRIPPYGMAYEPSRQRNVLPVPASQYGDPGPGGVFNHWDEIALHPPAGAKTAEIAMLYQPTSWEYIQFLYLANDGSITLLENEGAYLLEAWLNTGMAEPHEMASTQWKAEGEVPIPLDPSNMKPIR
jgi:hypothetical protein